MNEARLAEARELHGKGQLHQAIAIYRDLVAEDPGSAEVWHLKGLAEHQSGDLDAADASASRALAGGGEQPAFLYLAGSVLHDRGELDRAEAHLARAVAVKPDWVSAHLELGRIHLDQGRADDAVRDFQTVVTLKPDHVSGWNNLGIAFRTSGRMTEAERAFMQAIALDARYMLAHMNLARLHVQRPDLRRALQHAQIAARIEHGNAEAWMLVGEIHHRLREYEPALTSYALAVQQSRGDVKALTEYARVLGEAGRYEEARERFAQVARHAPGSLQAALGANLLLPQHYDSVGHLESIRERYAQGLGRLHARAGEFRFASAERALADARWTNFYLAYQGRNDVELQRQYGEFHRAVLQPAAPQWFERRPSRPRGSRIRVGFLSHFFFNCTAGRYFSSWITRLDRSRFETFVYYTNAWVADDTRAIAAAAATFRHLPGRSLPALAQQVAADGLDVLVHPELGMHPDNFTLAGLRLAPVQCAGWGHPTTSGLPEIDWFLSAGEMEPGDAAAHYTERLATLPGLGTHYLTPRAAGAQSRADFGIPEGRVAYLVPQSLFKIHPDNDELIARVLERDPRGVAVMFASRQDLLTQAFADRLAPSFKRRGMELNERVIFLAPELPHPTYLRLNQLCDVMLDTLHWSGGNTSIDALAMGLPVITLPGSLMRGRQSQAMLRILGADELIARDADDYVAKAEALATDGERRRALRESILANAPALFERDEPIRALESFLERAVSEAPS